MKKIYYVGDMLNNTGPAIVNKSYYQFLKNDSYFCFSNNKIIRTLHFISHFSPSKYFIISGFSKLNYLYIKLCNLFGKKVIYIMHGYLKYESNFKSSITSKKIEIEKKILLYSNKVVCVSKLFCDLVKKDNASIKEKIIYNYNGVDILNGIEVCKYEQHDSNFFNIVSVGGGNKQKNILSICKSLNLIKNKKIKFIVIGPEIDDAAEIKKYKFVEYYNNLNHNELLNKLFNADLYIQNSYFETFGITVIEALSCGCDILISKKIGVIDLLEGITESDIIYEPDNIDEIYNKVLKKMEQRGTCNINKNYNWRNQSQKLMKIIKEDLK